MPRTMISHQARTSSPPQALRPERPALSWAFSAPSARSGAYLLFWAARSPRLRSSRGTSSPSPLQRCQRACPSKARWALTPAWHVAADGSAAQGEVRVAQRWKQRRNTAICAIDPHNTSISPTNCMSPCRRAYDTVAGERTPSDAHASVYHGIFRPSSQFCATRTHETRSARWPKARVCPTPTGERRPTRVGQRRRRPILFF